MINTIGAAVGAGVGVVTVLGILWRIFSKVNAIEDVVCGVPADPIRGTEQVPSVGARLARLERAQADRTLTDQRLVTLETRLDEHLRTCGRPL